MRLLRWLGLSLLAMALLLGGSYAVVYLRSERLLQHVYASHVETVALPTEPAALAEGERLARLRGCTDGCHGKDGRGAVMFDDPLLGRIVAPNLPAAFRRYGTADLVRLLRHGLRPDGRSVLVMPAEEFTVLSDEDLGRILAYLGSLPPSTGPAPGITIGPLGRLGLVTGRFKTAAQLLEEASAPPPAIGDEAAFGRYLARSTCVQCHGSNLDGASFPDFTAPSLRIVAAYSLEDFTTLLRTGIAIGGRDPSTMGPWSRAHLALFTDAELAALHRYLHALTDTPPP